MAAITGIHIIEGKPSASAGLISALVRRAGHKLRVRGDGKSATCQIVRSDDPDYVFEVTWTLSRNPDGHPSAEEAGLSGKGTWKNYPASMLKSRAITQCARDACEEALYGLHYTPEELGAEVDGEGNVIAGTVVPDDPAPAGDASASANQEWLEQALADAANFADENAGRKLWDQVVAQRKAGHITTADCDRVKDLIRARWKAQAEAAEAQDADDGVVEGEIVPDLDPADPWALRIEEIASPDEAETLTVEVNEALTAGTLGDDKAAAIFKAIGDRERSLAAAA